MIPYATVWAFTFVLLVFLYRQKSDSGLRPFALVVFLSYIFLSVLRGNVGTDTLMYQDMVLHPEFYKNIGLAYYFLSSLFYGLSHDPVVTVRLLSLLFFMPLGYILFKSDKKLLFLFFALLAPWFFQLSMNTMRSGLAFSFFLLGLFLLTKQEKKSLYAGLFFFLFSTFVHISFLFPVLLAAPFLLDNGELKKILLTKKGVILIGIYLILLFLNYSALHFFLPHTDQARSGSLIAQEFSKKVNLYKSFQAPSALSGTSRVVMIFLALFLVFSLPPTKHHARFRKKFLYVFLSSLLLSFVVSRFSYAGLRLLDLVFLSSASMIFYYSMKNRDIVTKRVERIALLLFFISLLAFTRNFVNSARDYDTFGQSTATQSAFVPYRTLFEEKAAR